MQSQVIAKQRAAVEQGPMVDQHGRGRVISRDEPAVDGVPARPVELDWLVCQPDHRGRERDWLLGRQAEPTWLDRFDRATVHEQHRY